MSKTVVGFTSIPSRFDHLNETLKFLHKQTKMADKIYLYLPFSYKRFEGVQPNILPIEKIVEKYNNVKIVRGEDYGPISKLFVSLIEENDPDTNIIACDDDVLYDENWINSLVTEIEKNPAAAFGYRGRKFAQTLSYGRTLIIESKQINDYVNIDLITNIRGWIFKRKFFDESYIDRWQKTKVDHPYIFFNDDIWISGTLQEKGIKRTIFPCKTMCSSCRSFPDRLNCMQGQQSKTNQHIFLFKDIWKLN